MASRSLAEIDRLRPTRTHQRVLALREQCGKRFHGQHSSSFVDAPCPACESGGEEVFVKYGFVHRRCCECSTLWCSPRPTAELLSEYYACWEAPRYWTELLLATDADRRALQCEPRARHIVDLVTDYLPGPAGLAVDLGAGSGAFALALGNTGFFDKVVALDITSDCVDACLQRGLDARQATVSDLAPESVHLLTMNDLIEHVFDPRSLLRSCHGALTRSGLVSIATPNGEGFDFKVLKERTVNITPPEHLNYFNPRSMKLLLESVGFSVISVETPGILDTQIVVREALSNGFRLERSNEFLRFLLLESTSEVVDGFQRFLRDNLLSSHMLILGQKA